MEDERWRKLCLEAQAEPDGERLITLVQEINRLLDEKQLKRGLLKNGYACRGATEGNTEDRSKTAT